MITITGQVLGHDDRPLTNVPIKVKPTPGASVTSGGLAYIAPPDPVHTDTEGRFALAVKRIPGVRYLLRTGSSYALPAGLVLYCDDYADGEVVTLDKLVTYTLDEPDEPVEPVPS